MIKKTVLIVSFLLPLTMRAGAEIFTISNTNDSGDGSLYQAFLDSAQSEDREHTFIFDQVGGEISLAGGVPNLPGHITFNTLRAASAITIRGNNAFAGAGIDFENTSITGGPLTLYDSTYILHRANSYSGGTIIDNSTLQIDDDSNLGDQAGDLTLGGQLILAKGMKISRNIQLVYGREGIINTQDFDSTISGNIQSNGSHSMEKLGSGVLTLSGSNDVRNFYLLEGTLRLGSDHVFSNPIDLVIGTGKVLDVNGFNISVGRFTPDGYEGGNILLGTGTFRTDTWETQFFTGSISGPGKFIKSGSGELTLIGTNTYTGGTVVELGRLYGTTSSIGPGPIENSGEVWLSAENDLSEFSGVISGTGSVRLYGNIYLKGKNTLTGGFLVHWSPLFIDSGEALGAPSNEIILDHSTLNLLKSCKVINELDVTSGAGIVDNGLEGVLSGPIHGSYFSKYGTGTITLEGRVDLTSSVSVGEGTLKFGKPNILNPEMGIDSYPETTIDFDGNNQHIRYVDAYNAVKLGTAFLHADLYTHRYGTLTTTLSSPDLHGQIDSQRVELGPKLNLRLLVSDTFNRDQTQKFTIVSAPFIYGKFDSIFSPAALKFEIHYSSESIEVEYQGVNYSAASPESNRKNVSSVLDGLRDNPTSDLKTVLDTINTLEEPYYSSVLDQITPISLVSMAGIEKASAKSQLTSVQRRFFGLHDGEESDHVSVYDTRAANPGVTLIAAGGSADYNNNRYTTETRRSPWGYFGSVNGSNGRLGSINSGLGVQPGYSFSTNGFNVGVDRRLTDSFILGVTGGYSSGNSDLDFDQGSAKIKSVIAGIYGTNYSRNGVFMDAYIGGSFDSYDTNRRIPFMGRTATGHPSGTSINSILQFGLDRHIGKKKISPVVALEYNRATIDSFSEDGANALNLNVQQQTASSLLSIIGGRVSRDFGKGKTVWTPSLQLGWEHEYLSDERSIDAQFHAGGGAFGVQTAQAGTDAAVVNIALASRFSERVGAQIGYHTELARENLTAQSVDGRVNVRF